MFRSVRVAFEQVLEVVGNSWKIVKNVVIIIQGRLHVSRNGLSLLVFNIISHLLVAVTLGALALKRFGRGQYTLV